MTVPLVDKSNLSQTELKKKGVHRCKRVVLPQTAHEPGKKIYIRRSQKDVVYMGFSIAPSYLRDKERKRQNAGGGWLSLVVMSNQRFLKIESFRFPTFVKKKNRIYSFFKLNLLLNRKVFFQI